jgi:tight adherence protein B
MSPLVLLLLSAAAAGGVLLAFVMLAVAPAPARSAAGGRSALDLPFQAVAERFVRRDQRRGRAPLPERLARAGLRFRPSEYVMAQVGAAGALGLLCLVRFGIGVAMVAGVLVGLVLPGFYVRLRTGRRLKKLNGQLVDVLGLMANSLKAGHALPQTLELVARDAGAPIAEEFARCVRELQVGGSQEEALTNLARRTGSDDLELVVTAMLVQLTVGGNLAATLETVSHTIRERVRIKGEISAATAQGRVSGIVITGMPIAVAALLYVISPTYFRPMTQQPLGWLMLGAAAVMIGIGNLVIRRIVKIDI